MPSLLEATRESSDAKNMRTANLLTVTFFLALSGCIGVIEEAATPVATTDSNPVAVSQDIRFDGVEQAKGIAHNKIEVRFRPASGGSGQFSYRAYLDGSSSSAASISGASSVVDVNGLITLVVPGLKREHTYNIVIKAHDPVANKEDPNTKQLAAATLAYEVPDFSGLAALENVAGADGQTQLLARWSPATPSSVSSNPFEADPNAISGYNVYIGQSEDALSLYGSIGSIADPKPLANQFLITGLQSGINYYVRVRALNSEAAAPREDLNSLTLQRKTLTKEPIRFEGLGTLSIPTTSDGYNKIKLSWAPGTGNYSRYRLFVSTDATSVFDPTTAQPFAPDITTLGTTSIQLTVPTPHTVYYAAIVACSDSNCTEYRGHDVVRAVRTSPPVAPFNGIDTITAPTGDDGLTSLILNWSLPNTLQGDYTEIRVFKTNGNGNYNAATDLIGAFDPATPAVMGIAAATPTSVTLKGLRTEEEYCFIAKAYAASPADPENPSGRTHANERKVCGIPKYSAPGFSGLKSACKNFSSTGFTVEWNTPNPVGIYSFYEIWYRRASTGTFSYAEAQAGHPDSVKVTAANSATSYTFSNLTPATNYRIGMRTYFSNPASGQVFRDTNVVTTACATQAAKVEHKGWMQIVALGPKINGLAVPPAPLLERFTIPGTDGIPADGVDNVFRHRYPQESPFGVQGSTASRTGMVRLMWEDFVLSAGLGTMYNFNATANTGYKIFRKAYRTSHATIQPTIVADVSEGTWTELTPTPIPAKRELYPGTTNWAYFGEFVDYSIDRSGLAANETKIYWYKVEAYINGIKVDFETTPPDGVVKIIVPPNNMGLMHRWMANKDFCDAIKRSPQRNQNYRCAYNGIGSVGGFYDMQHHLLIDRFHLGTNFSRGNSSKRCTQNSGDPAHYYPNDSANNGTLDGDCIAWQSLYSNTVMTASAPGTVMMLQGDYWNETAINIPPAHDNTLTNWYRPTDLQPDNLTRFDATTSVLPPQSDEFPLGRGYGTLMTSNNAKLHVTGHISYVDAQALCASHDVRHLGQSRRKRLPRIKEKTRYMSFGAFADARFDSLASEVQNTNTADRDCDQSSPLGGKFPYGNFIDFNDPDKSGFRYLNGNAGAFSTEACTTLYGAQHPNNDTREWTGDYWFCDPSWGCSAGYRDEAETVPLENKWDPGLRDTWKSGNGLYANMKYSGASFMAFSPIWWGYWADNWNFFSPAVGLPLDCVGGACQFNGESDDNERVTAKATGAAVSNFFGSLLSRWSNAYTLESAAAGGAYYTLDGNARYMSAINRHTYIYYATDPNNKWHNRPHNSAARCATAIGD